MPNAPDDQSPLASEVYPAGVPCWIDRAPPDIDGAAAFYGGLFGWEFEDLAPAGSVDRCLVGRLEGRHVAALRSPADGGHPGAAWTTYVCVDDAAERAARVAAAGGRVVAGPAAIAGAARVSIVADPAGATFGLWEPRGLRGAQLVNAPGTWNFSDLATADPAAAQAFYGAVFGWEARTVALGPMEATMWCLRGYGEVQDAKEPGFLWRHAESGTPEGFTDAFGWLVPPTGEPLPPGVSARWEVTFAVADADDSAARAGRLGGTVEVPPFDAGDARLAVLRDPWGARLTVSAYAPGE